MIDMRVGSDSQVNLLIPAGEIRKDHLLPHVIQSDPHHHQNGKPLRVLTKWHPDQHP